MLSVVPAPLLLALAQALGDLVQTSGPAARQDALREQGALSRALGGGLRRGGDGLLGGVVLHLIDRGFVHVVLLLVVVSGYTRPRRRASSASIGAKVAPVTTRARHRA